MKTAPTRLSVEDASGPLNTRTSSGLGSWPGYPTDDSDQRLMFLKKLLFFPPLTQHFRRGYVRSLCFNDHFLATDSSKKCRN